MNEISDFNAARKCGPITVVYQTTEDNLDGSPWPPDGNDHWCVVCRANGRTKWRLIHLSPLRAPISPPTARVPYGGIGDQAMTQTSRDVAVQHNVEIENLRAAAQQDAGFEKMLKFKKGEYSIADEPVALGT